MVEMPIVRDLVLTREEHYKDMLNEAATERLVSHGLTQCERGSHLYCQALAWLGQQLVAWGWRLQERYGTMSKTAASLAANRTG